MPINDLTEIPIQMCGYLLKNHPKQVRFFYQIQLIKIKCIV